MKTEVKVVRKGFCDYTQVWQEMIAFTLGRGPDTRDQIWVLQHYPVYTQGTSCKELPRGGEPQIPVVKTDRGGQITYHGPGQLIVYFLLDIKRKQLGPKTLVQKVEQALIDLLGQFDLSAHRTKGAPGVYLGSQKIAALGFRIKKGCCYHGLSLNLDMDLTPFSQINPCGFPGQKVTQLSAKRVDWVKNDEDRVSKLLVTHLCNHLELAPI